jgi:hypothetical protein
MTALVAAALLWPAVTLALGLLIGRVLRRADAEDVGLEAEDRPTGRTRMGNQTDERLEPLFVHRVDVGEEDGVGDPGSLIAEMLEEEAQRGRAERVEQGDQQRPLR